MIQPHPIVHQPSQPAIVEGLESRRLLAASAAPIPSLVGQYVGTFQAVGVDPQPLTVSIATQKKRSFTGSFIEGDVTTAVFRGSISKTGLSKFSFHNPKGQPKFNGTAIVGLNSTGDALTGLILTHNGKLKVTASFAGVKQVAAANLAS